MTEQRPAYGQQSQLASSAAYDLCALVDNLPPVW